MKNGEAAKKGARSKKKPLGIREFFRKYGRRAEKLIEDPSPQALAVAAAAGTLIGAFWSAIRAEKPAPPERKPKSPPDV